jgi:MFS family permease
MLMLLWLTYTFSVLDRYVMGILVEPIKRDLGVSDTMMGFLSGTIFGLFYATLAIPVAMLADRSNRRNVIAASLFIWSLCTMLCGMAANAMQLALARIFVGVGEAGSSPPAQSVISDLFPSAERGRAVGLFASGGSLGMVLAYTLSGLIAGEWGWRWAFILLGAPGILLALTMVLTTREPLRGQSDAGGQKNADALTPPFAEVVRFILGNRGLVHLIVALIVTTTSASAIALWVPAYLTRTFAVSAAQLGPALGLVIGIAGMIGAIAMGWLSDRIARKQPSRRVLVGAVMQMLVWPFMIVMLLAGSYVTALWLLVVPGFFIYAPVAVGWAIMQNISPPRMRATIAGIGVLVANIGSLVIGPQVIGLASDWLADGDATIGLRNALLLFSVLYPWAAFHYLRAAKLLGH